MSEFTMDDMINSVIEKKPETFKDAFNDMMAQKAIEAIEARKQTIAQSMFNSGEEESEQSDEEQNELELEDENVEDS